jgi:hypothetical protein
MTTAPDMLRQFGGAPVGGGGYQGWWGGDVFFVDYDGGSVGSAGKRPDDAIKHLADAIVLAGANDTIYVRPQPPKVGGDPLYYESDPKVIVPESTTNWTIPYTSYGLSLIGTGIGVGSASAQQACLQGASGATATDPVISLNAPFCTIENIGIKSGASTASLVFANYWGDTAVQAFANSFYNVWFRNTLTSKGLHINSGNYDNVIKCNFSSCLYGIYLETDNSETSSLIIRDCDFLGLIAEITCDIWSTGGAKRVLITKCNFNHALPTGGGVKLYISFGATSTGIFSDSYMGAAVTTIETNTTLNGIFHSGVWTANGLSD